MAETPAERTPRTTIDVAPGAIAKVIAAVAMVWLWLHLWQLFMVVLVAIVVAIGLDPIVCRLQRHVSRALAATAVVVLLAVLIAGFFWITGASLTMQAQELGGGLHAALQKLGDRMPMLTTAIRRSGAPLDPLALAPGIMNAGRVIVSGLVVVALILILTIYLLIEGRQTYTWLVAYAPPGRRDRVHVTAGKAREAIYAYVVGNVVTSIFATIVVFVALSLMHVPAALLLAMLAGIFDFVPVLGFICSSVPAVLLALTRSAPVAAGVAAVYLAYHTAENYYIGPRIYGERLKLSNLAVILAFAVGAEIGGIGGALLALPLAALYPVLERVWLKDYLNRDAVATHQRMQHESSTEPLQ